MTKDIYFLPVQEKTGHRKALRRAAIWTVIVTRRMGRMKKEPKITTLPIHMKPVSFITQVVGMIAIFKPRVMFMMTKLNSARRRNQPTLIIIATSFMHLAIEARHTEQLHTCKKTLHEDNEDHCPSKTCEAPVAWPGSFTFYATASRT